MRAGEDTSLTYIVNGTVDGAPKEIVKQVENQAQAAAKDFQGIGEPDISSILVCEVRFSDDPLQCVLLMTADWGGIYRSSLGEIRTQLGWPENTYDLS